MSSEDSIAAFLDGDRFAVVGATTDRTKYGNKVLRAYLQSSLAVYPVNPKATEIEGVMAYGSLGDLPEQVHGVSFVTPPSVTLSILKEAADMGIRHVWLQPGAENPAAIALADAAGMNVIAGGPCILVRLGYREQ